MRTVIETLTFQKQAAEIWHEEERHAFIDWIAENLDSGDVIPGADGARKVRWARKGMGKRGGARVIYFHLVDDEVGRGQVNTGLSQTSNDAEHPRIAGRATAAEDERTLGAWSRSGIRIHLRVIWPVEVRVRG